MPVKRPRLRLESREFAGKLLLIGTNMQNVYDSNIAGQQQWAFQ
jgi:hypothetical protein